MPNSCFTRWTMQSPDTAKWADDTFVLGQIHASGHGVVLNEQVTFDACVLQTQDKSFTAVLPPFCQVVFWVLSSACDCEWDSFSDTVDTSSSLGRLNRPVSVSCRPSNVFQNACRQTLQSAGSILHGKDIWQQSEGRLLWSSGSPGAVLGKVNL